MEVSMRKAALIVALVVASSGCRTTPAPRQAAPTAQLAAPRGPTARDLGLLTFQDFCRLYYPAATAGARVPYGTSQMIMADYRAYVGEALQRNVNLSATPGHRAYVGEGLDMPETPTPQPVQ
jgi:hypothetical protein